MYHLNKAHQTLKPLCCQIHKEHIYSIQNHKWVEVGSSLAVPMSVPAVQESGSPGVSQNKRKGHPEAPGWQGRAKAGWEEAVTLSPLSAAISSSAC